MKLRQLFSILLLLPALSSFSQEKNCNVIHGGPIYLDYTIWKENVDSIFCILKNNSSSNNRQDEEYYKLNFDISKNKTWMFYDRDTLVLSQKFTIKDSLFTSEFEKNYFNGNKKEKAYYLNGKLEGQRYTYYKNSKLESFGEYKNGEINGALISYYNNGFIACTTNSCDGHRVSVSYRYWDNDQLASVHFSTENSSRFIPEPLDMYFDQNGGAISEMEFKLMWNCNY
jgi:antitoxin component YwqK of YwqJK toxin-antitoxin module